MSRRMILAVVMLCFTQILCTTASEEPSDVIVLTPANFDEHVGTDDAVFVKFYAPWCGHCKKLAPDYDKAGTAFKNVKGASIAKVDCDSHKELCSRFGITGYPTLKFFPSGSQKPEDYNGGRTTEDIINFVNKQAGTKAKVVAAPSDVVTLDVDNFDEIVLDESKFVLVEFYAPWCGHCKSLAPIYEKLATALKGEKSVVIAKVDADNHKILGEKYGVSGFPTIKSFPKDNKAGEPYDGDRSLTALLDFVNEKAGTFRSASGRLNSDAGRIPELDELAQEFIEAESTEDRDAVATKITAVVAQSSAKSAGQYLKVIKSINEKGVEYPAKESARLKKVLKGKVSPAKVDDFTIRLNILASFLPSDDVASS